MLNVLTVPNLLTLLRIVAIPIFLILLEDLRYREALGIFVAAGLTDALDGAIARLTRTQTTFGAYLDPAADKLLLVSAFIALGFMHEVPRWLVVLVISRDAIIVLGFFLLFMRFSSRLPRAATTFTDCLRGGRYPFTSRLTSTTRSLFSSQNFASSRSRSDF